MSQLRKNPITINEGFRCKKCGKENPKALKSCRNHCRYCFYSQHVDKNTPGDRLSDCLGLMEPVKMTYHNKKGYQIIHVCQKCQEKSTNKVAEDDNQELVTRLIQIQNTNFLPNDNDR